MKNMALTYTATNAIKAAKAATKLTEIDEHLMGAYTELCAEAPAEWEVRIVAGEYDFVEGTGLMKIVRCMGIEKFVSTYAGQCFEDALLCLENLINGYRLHASEDVALKAKITELEKELAKERGR